MKIYASIFLLVALRLGAATYYISSSGGSDINNGTSTGTPWQTLSNACRTIITSGDTILLKSGDTFEGTIIVSQAVTVGSYGGSVKPIIRGDHPSLSWFPVAGHVGVYSNAIAWLPSVNPANIQQVYDTNGVFYTNIGRPFTDSLAVWLNKIEATNPPCWGSDNAEANIYVKTLDSNAPPQLHLFDFNVVKALGSHTTIKDLEVKFGNPAIYVTGSGNVVSNNFCHDNAASGIELFQASNSEVVSNTVSTNGYTCIYVIYAGSNHIHRNTLYKTSTTICGNVVMQGNPDTSGIGLLSGTNNLVEINDIRFMRQAFFDFFYEVNSELRFNYGFHAAVGAVPSGTGLKFHHNILNMDSAGSGINAAHAYSPTFSPLPDSGTVWVYNNDVIDFLSFGAFTLPQYSTNVNFRNNNFVTVSTTAAMANVNPGVSMDYDLYFCTGGTAKQWTWTNTAKATLAIFQSASGQELHGKYIDPRFVSATPVLPADFLLKYDSPAVRVGVFTFSGNDFNGMAMANPPSIGAFEFYGPTNIAASCSQVDIQNAISVTSPGGVVLVPAGTCAPTISILLTNQISLIAQGTILQDSIINTGDGANSSIIQVSVGPSPTNMTRVAGFTFTTGARGTKLFDSGNIHLGGGANNVRIDHNTFLAANNIGIGGGDVFGVVDHNVFAPPGAFTQPMKLTHQTYGGALNGYGAWALPSWTNSYHEDASAIYIEDNNFTNSSGAPGIGIDGFGGARWVTRHNIFDRQIDGGHGTETTAQFAGCRLKDSYNNLFIEHGDSECGHWRSGSGVWVSNTIVSSTSGYTCRNYRMAFGGFYKYANGTNSWDNNDPVIYGTGTATAGGTLAMTDSTKAWTVNQWQGYSIRNVNTERCSLVSGNTATTVSYIPSTDDPAGNTVFSPGQVYQFRKVITVLDEVGRGQGALRNNTVPAWPNQAVDPVWQWSNTLNGGSVTMNNGGYYSSVVGQEIRNEVNLSWVPFTYPHPLISGTNNPTVNPPVITQQPKSTNVYSSQTALFTIAATGTAPLSYQWSTNGVAAGTNGPALSVGPAPVAWSGMSVVCVVANAGGGTTSATATLTVLPDPVITGQPSNATVGVGSTASFSVTATGQSGLAYQWKKNGSSILGATHSSYVTPATVSGDNNSQFAALVTDTAGSVQSANATLTVVDLPVITAQPQSTNIFATQSALFRITATGGTLTYQWKTNGVSTGTNGPALAVGPAPVAWSGMTVVCVVTNLAGAVTSSTATLTVGADPVISTQPANATVAVGATATFTVTATGQTTLSYQWSKNGSSIGGATQSSYTTPVTVAGDNGSQFFVVVTDTAGSLQSANATLTVTGGAADPLITVQPQSVKVFATQTANFTITATGGSTLHYQWKTNGVNTGTDSSSLSIANCPVAWSGILVLCVVTDLGPDSPATSSTATLTVGADPVIGTQPANATVGVGATANFTVTATGQTALSYQWSKNGVSIGGATLSSYTTPATVPGDNNAQFFVVVTDTAGSLQSANATLTVTNIISPDPLIVAQPQSTNVFATQAAIFRITAAGNSPLSYQWKTNGVNAGTNGPAISFASCPVEWSGMTVVCVVTDSAGFATSSIATLTVGADPVITVQPQSVSRQVNQTATFSVTATGQTSLSYQWSLNGVAIGGATSSSYTTPALSSPNNGDSYFVDVTDSAGTLRSATATLTVVALPTKIAHGHIVKVKVGTTGP